MAAVSYAVGIVAQTVAARRADSQVRFDVGLVARLATDRVYLFGFGAQVLGFVMAFLARGDLPLYLVQAGASSAVGIAALVGAVVLGWRISRGEAAALVVMAGGLLLLAGASVPSQSADLPIGVAFSLVVTLVLVAVLAGPAARLGGPRSAVVLAVLTGLAFSVLAIASRPLAAGPLLELPLRPLFWLMVLAAVVGQTLMATALQRGSTTSVMATMDATGVVISSVVGLAVLGDLIADGRGSWVAIGLVLVVSGVLALAALLPAQRPDPTAARTTEAVRAPLAAPASAQPEAAS